MQLNELTDRILAHVYADNYQPVKQRTIAKQLSIGPDDEPLLKKAVKKLVKKGRLAYGDKHLIFPVVDSQAVAARPPAEPQRPQRKSNVTGSFTRTSKGYGFVRPHGTDRAEGRNFDIFIPQEDTRDAADGDVVEVSLSHRRGPMGKRRGRIVQVLERQTHQFVGVYHERGGAGYVQVDGAIFAQPVYVGDAGAKNAMEDDKVVIELVRFPTHFQEGEGVITEVLGPRGAPGVDALSIIMEFGLPQDFSEAVLESAREQAERFDESIGPDRQDMTDEVVITIDPVDARDFDDAISLRKTGNGHWLLGVHIADVAHFVPEGSALDHEARERATSVYLPDRVIPMLPEIISNNLASLQPDKVRYARTAMIEMTPDGARVATEVHSTAIKSRRRFTYEEVDEFLADRESWREKLSPEVFALLANMHELAMILRRRRLEGGAIEMHLPEVKIDLDKFGRVTGAHVVENTESHQIIEEFMLGANEAVAERLHDDEILFLRRIHEPPDPRKLGALTTFVRELGLECESLESRFEIKRVLEETADRPEAYAIHYAVLRSMSKAVYGPMESGHYALAMADYCHFTSPIRRYPDLTVHRIFDKLARGKKQPGDFDALALMGDHCSDREQRAEKAERELKKTKLLNFLSQKIGYQMEGVVTGVEEFGLFVQGIDIPAEGLLHVQALGDDYFHYDKPTHTLMGHKAGNQFRLGDGLQVEVVRVDLERRELDFRLASKPQRKRTAEGQKKTAGTKSAPKGTQRKSGQRKTSQRKGTRPPPEGSQGKRRKTSKRKRRS